MNFRRMLTVARTEWIHNIRDVRSLFVVAALPVVLLLLYGYGISFDIDNIPFAVWDQDGSETGRDFIERFRSNRYFNLHEVLQDRHRADELLDSGEVVFVMVIPPDFGSDLGAGRHVDVQILMDGADNTRGQSARGYIESLVSEYSADLATEYLSRSGAKMNVPFTVAPTILFNPALESRFFIVPGLIAVILALLSSLLTSTCIVRERELGSFEALVVSPAGAAEIMVGKILPYVLIAFVDVLLCIFIGWAVFGVAPVGSLIFLALVGGLYLSACLAIGLFFSAIAHSQQFAIVLTMMTTMLPTILLSGFVFSYRSMPFALRIISNMIPATHFLVIIRSIYLKGAGPFVLWPHIIVLLVFTVLLVAAAARAFRKSL